MPSKPTLEQLKEILNRLGLSGVLSDDTLKLLPARIESDHNAHR